MNDISVMPTKNGAHAPNVSAASPNPFRARMPLGEFLFEYLYHRGVRHSFGIPGDFALSTYASLEKSKICSITTTHEPGAGFAA